MFRKDCADQFLVKSWQYMDPNKYQDRTTFDTQHFYYCKKNLVVKSFPNVYNKKGKILFSKNKKGVEKNVFANARQM